VVATTEHFPLLALTNGFELSFSEAMPYMEMYNQHCDPPWIAKDLEHKVRESIRIPTKNRVGIY